jgi:hypothetical protein
MKPRTYIMRGARRSPWIPFAALGLLLLLGSTAWGEPSAFIGVDACEECHEQQVQTYREYSKKAKSSKSIKIMASDLTQEELKDCFGCHTTGYGKPGGFRSFQETPEMADLGCESCHGPGQAHMESGGDPELIKGDLKVRECESCHNQERIRSFNFKPLLFGGAH